MGEGLLLVVPVPPSLYVQTHAGRVVGEAGRCGAGQAGPRKKDGLPW